MAGRILSQLKPKVLKVCRCGSEFMSSCSRQIYCSNKCCGKFRRRDISETKQRDFDYKRHYGISLEEYNQMFLEQNGCCKICKRHQTEFKRRLHVDHSHATNEVRGLLCHNCNLALGRFMDNKDIIKAALEYLK